MNPVSQPLGFFNPAHGASLTGNFRVVGGWGERLVLAFNGAYVEILGEKQPLALRASFPDVWSETGDETPPRLSSALAGRASYAETREALVNRGTPGEK